MAPDQIQVIELLINEDYGGGVVETQTKWLGRPISADNNTRTRC